MKDITDKNKSREPGEAIHDTPDQLQLTLDVTEPDVIAALLEHPEGRSRDRFALNALRIGVLALKQASGRLDADLIKREGSQLLSDLGHALERHQSTVEKELADSLRLYFDPKDGRFNERIERLAGKDGELERFMARHIGSDDSQLAKTLAAHIGEQSPLMKLLSPDASEGFLKAVALELEQALKGQRESLLSEFSLDNEQSALSRLVHRVESSQREVKKEFSLDEENSALARMKRELTELLASHKKSADEFQENVTSKLSAMAARREESLRSTRHGGEFEDEAFAFIAAECQRSQDIAENTSNSTGVVKNCKVGDIVIELGPDSAAAGARIVVEVKQSESYTHKKAMEEIELARKNRSATVGIFLFSKRSAPESLEPVARYGSDIVVIWDSTDPQSDIYLKAGLTIAKAICTQGTSTKQTEGVDFEPAERAIRAIEKLASGLSEIKTSSETIHSSSNKILKRVRIMSDEIERQVTVLDKSMQKFRSSIPSS